MKAVQIEKLERGIIARFCLYGFLKNQRYFEPFILLAFMEKGLSFFQIGLLVGFRALVVNLLEIPSGAIADLYGRIRTMIFAFCAHTLCFLVFAFSEHLWHLFAAMLLFGIGEAFRTGTHKAIIFDYLKSRGQQDQKVRIYGLTRSFSETGSALSAIIAAILIFWRGNYSDIFWLCAIPSLLNIINFLGYPEYLEKKSANKSLDFKLVYLHVYNSFRGIWNDSCQGRIILESCCFDGTLKVVKDYNQIVIKKIALGLPLFTAIASEKRVALLIGIVYSSLYIMTSISARISWRICAIYGNEDNASRRIWQGSAALYSLMAVSLFFDLPYFSILPFIAILILHSMWRPIMMGRINTCCRQEHAATTLSIESQSSSFFAMLLAPLLGFAVDSFGLTSIAIVGFVICLSFILTGKRSLAELCSKSSSHT